MHISSSMDISGAWKYLAAWFVMLLVSIVYGAARDLTFGKYMSELAAHQLSTVTSVLALGAVIWGLIRICPPSSSYRALAIGQAWTALTVAFEFILSTLLAAIRGLNCSPITTSSRGASGSLSCSGSPLLRMSSFISAAHPDMQLKLAPCGCRLTRDKTAQCRVARRRMGRRWATCKQLCH